MSKIALYIRLSVERDRETESESIKNQRDLLNKYVNDNFSDIEVVEYIDEGFSGTSFDRPAFNLLIKSIENNEISIVLVKDLSRLGRNYIDSLHYIEQVFPMYNVKLIAINDNIDTNGLETSFKALLNSYYSKDLSKKVKSSYRNKISNGDWLCDPFYGYKRSETEKNKLEIDVESGNVVIEIFKMALDGFKIKDIAKKLNDMDILTPMKYSTENRRSTRKGWTNKSDEVYWTYNNVYRILKDEKYTGKLIFNKKELIYVGSSKSRKTDKSEWIIVEDAIEPLVSQEDFDKVQDKMCKPNHIGGVKSNDVFLNKIVCGNCNRNLYKYNYKYKGKNTIKYNCRFYKTTSKELCFNGYLYRDDLINVICENIKMQMKVFSDLKENTEIKKEQYKNKISKLTQKERDLKSEIKKASVRKNQLIEKLLDEKIVDAEFKKQTNDIEVMIDSYEAILKQVIDEKKQIKLELDTKKYEMVLELLNNGLLGEVGLKCIIEFIDKVIVYDKDKIEISFNFDNVFL